jgi:outer membrane biosynthesis protein TonB
MHISINTAEEISDLDRQVLGLLAGGSFVLGGAAETFEEPEEEPEPEPEPVKPAAKKAAAKKAAAKKPEPEPEPEPMAEEPLEEEPEDEDLLGEESDEDLLALAVKKATEMVGSGQAGQVREALEAAGAARVRELNADNVREFFKALG